MLQWAWDIQHGSLKIKTRHGGHFVVAGGTTGCHTDNLWCHQWRQSDHHDKFRFSVASHCPGQHTEELCTNPVLSCAFLWFGTLQWHHNESHGVSNYRRLHCLLNGWFRRRLKKTSNIRVTGLCAGNSSVNSPHKGPVTQKMFPFDDGTMNWCLYPYPSGLLHYYWDIYTIALQYQWDNVEWSWKMCYMNLLRSIVG